jgi:2-dehydro-3-deoxygluconokinase
MITLDDHQAVFECASLDDALAHAQGLTIPEVVIKRGADPTLVRQELSSEWLHIPTQEVEQVVDTTAAGDSFAAGYLSRRLCGNNAENAATFGNALAAKVIQYRGALIPLEAMKDLIPSQPY